MVRVTIMADASATTQSQTPSTGDADASGGGEKNGGMSQKKEEKMREWFIGSIDQGTTSSRFLIFDGTGTPVASHQVEFKQMYPESG